MSLENLSPLAQAYANEDYWARKASEARHARHRIPYRAPLREVYKGLVKQCLRNSRDWRSIAQQIAQGKVNETA